MPFFSGLAQALGQNIHDTRAENMRQAEAQADRENRVLQTLATSEDPEIAAHGIAGLMDQSLNRPQKGLRGWLGQMQGNPALPKIRDLVAKGRQQIPQEAPLVQGEDTGGTPAAATPPPKGGAALPAGGATEPGAAPLSMQAIEQAPPQALASGGMGGTVRPMPQPLQTVPRSLGISPAEHAGATAEAEKFGGLRGTFRALGGGDTGAGLDPTTFAYARAHALNQPTSRTTDAQGNEHFFIGNQEIGGPAAGVAKPSGPVGTEQQQVVQYKAAHPGVSDADALTAVRGTAAGVTANKAESAALAPAATRQSMAMNAARMSSLTASAARTWQEVNGTTPMNPEQSLTAARQALGNDPSITTDDVTRLADSLRAATAPKSLQGPPNAAAQGGQPAVVPPPAPKAAPALVSPTPGAPPRPGSLQAATAATGLGDTAHNYKAYSEGGKTTMTALTAVEGLLKKVKQSVMAVSPDKSNNPLPEKIAQELYKFGISPGDDMEALLQNAGMSKGYGLRGLLGGRSNQKLQEVYGQHLVDPGDSPQMILRKINTLEANLPDIRAAVDAGERANISGKGGKGATPPPGSASGTIKMRAPDGTIKPVPVDQVEHYKAKGAQVVQ